MLTLFFIHTSLQKSPDFPPLLRSSMTSRMTIPRSTALHISYSVSAATEAAVNASISMPVLCVQRSVETMRTSVSEIGVISISMPSMGSGWHIGMSSQVRFAAIIPAIRAQANTSPLGISPDKIRDRVWGCMDTTACAEAERRVTSFSPTSTIRAAPLSSICVRDKANRSF